MTKIIERVKKLVSVVKKVREFPIYRFIVDMSIIIQTAKELYNFFF